MHYLQVNVITPDRNQKPNSNTDPNHYVEVNGICFSAKVAEGSGVSFVHLHKMTELNELHVNPLCTKKPAQQRNKAVIHNIVEYHLFSQVWERLLQ